jgi:hypothetical protein
MENGNNYFHLFIGGAGAAAPPKFPSERAQQSSGVPFNASAPPSIFAPPTPSLFNFTFLIRPPPPSCS